MARIITKELAEKIVEKMKARDISTKGSPHAEYAFEYKGVLIAVIRIRRGSEKDKGDDYIPKEIHLSSGQAKRLAQCPLKYEKYIDILKRKSVVPLDPGEVLDDE